MANILVVGPHPDDQELGMGATIARLAEHDALTSLSNRRVFQAQLDGGVRVLLGHDRSAGRPVRVGASWVRST